MHTVPGFILSQQVQMSGYEGRTKGKRFRKPQSGGSNVKERWKYLSAQTSDVLETTIGEQQHGDGATSTAKAKQQPARKSRHGSQSAHHESSSEAPALAATTVAMRVGYDIDGDGQIDVREMRLAKFLDAMMDERQRQQQPPSESELTRMRQEAGRLLIAREFVERNHDRLWRYGSIFTSKSETQSAEFIAAHRNFKKLMPFLESLERKRTIRSSQNLRNCVQSDGDDQLMSSDAQQDAKLVRQTWIETSRKVYNPVFSVHPLPELQPKKKVNLKELHPVAEDDGGQHSYPPQQRSDVLFNTYGAIDVDGDGIVDDDEMKLHLRLQEATLEDNNNSYSGNYGHSSSSGMAVAAMNPRELRQHQQLEGRKMMAKDFVQRNEGQLWLYEPSYRDKSSDEITQQIAGNTQFAKEFNKLRAKERVLRLKSSMGVSNCLVQLPVTQLPADPSNVMEFRRVRHRSELLLARKELLKPSQHHAMQQQQMQMQQRYSVGSAPVVNANKSDSNPHGLRLRAVREDRRDLSRTASDSQIGLPRIYDTPVRIEATGSFSVTKWKFGD